MTKSDHGVSSLVDVGTINTPDVEFESEQFVLDVTLGTEQFM